MVSTARSPPSMATVCLGLAEVEAAGEFAHDEHVEAVGNRFRLDRRGVEQAGVAFRGAQIGVEAEVFAQRQKRGAFRLLVGRAGSPISGRRWSRRKWPARRGSPAACAAGSASPNWSMAAPPTAYSFASILKPKRFAAASRTSRPTAMTSGPMPSPARTAIL